MTAKIIHLYGSPGSGKDTLSQFFLEEEGFTKISLLAYDWNQCHRLAMDILRSKHTNIIIDEVVDDPDRLDPLFEIMTNDMAGLFKFILHSQMPLPEKYQPYVISHHIARDPQNIKS